MGVVLNWSSDYPGSIDTVATNFPTLQDGIHELMASNVNSLASAVVALENEVEQLRSLSQQILWQWNESDLTQFGTPTIAYESGASNISGTEMFTTANIFSDQGSVISYSYTNLAATGGHVAKLYPIATFTLDISLFSLKYLFFDATAPAGLGFGVGTADGQWVFIKPAADTASVSDFVVEAGVLKATRGPNNTMPTWATGLVHNRTELWAFSSNTITSSGPIFETTTYGFTGGGSGSTSFTSNELQNLSGFSSAWDGKVLDTVFLCIIGNTTPATVSFKTKQLYVGRHPFGIY